MFSPSMCTWDEPWDSFGVPVTDGAKELSVGLKLYFVGLVEAVDALVVKAVAALGPAMCRGDVNGVQT